MRQTSIFILLATFGCAVFSPVSRPTPPAGQVDRWQTATFLGKSELPNCWTWGVALQGNNLFMAGDEETKSLWVLDVSDPARPKVVSTWGPYYGFPQEIAVQGNYAYVPDSYNLLIFDISAPSAPQLVSRRPLGGPDDNGARDVVVRGNLAYVAIGAWSDKGLTPQRGFAVVDVSNPKNPTVIGTLDLSGGPVHLSMAGDYVYLAALAGGLQIVSVADPAKPVRVAEYIPSPASSYFDKGSVTGAAVSRTVAFVLSLDGPQQVLITALDVHDPAHPRVISSAAIPGVFGGGYYKGNITQITPDGIAFMVAQDTLTVLDVSDPSKMNIVSTFSLPTKSTGIYAESVQGEWVPRTIEGFLPWFNDFYYDNKKNVGYLIDTRWGLWTLDMTNLQQPKLLGALPAAGEARIIKVVGNRAYLSDFNGGIFVFDVADPKAPKLLGQYWDGLNFHSFSANTRGLLYIPYAVRNPRRGSGRSGILILDAENPSQLKKAGIIYLPDVAGVKMEDVSPGTGIFLHKDKLYVSHRGVLFIFGTHGTSADLLGYIAVAEAMIHIPPGDYDVTPPPQVYVKQRGRRVLAYVSDYPHGLSIVDVTDARSPRIIGQLNRPTHWQTSTSIDVQGNYAYISQWNEQREKEENGVLIVDVSNPESPRLVSVFCTRSYDPRYDSGRPTHVRVEGDRAWVADYGCGVSVWDISDRANPRFIDGPIRTTSVNQFSLDLSRGNLFRADVGALEVYKVLP